MFTVSEVIEPCVTVTIEGLMETLNDGETWACRQEAASKRTRPAAMEMRCGMKPPRSDVYILTVKERRCGGKLREELTRIITNQFVPGWLANAFLAPG